MTQIIQTKNVKNLQDLLRPFYENNIFKSTKIQGFENIHENIGIFLGPNCTNEQFHNLAAQIASVFPVLAGSVFKQNTESALQVVELTSSMAKVDLNEE